VFFFLGREQEKFVRVVASSVAGVGGKVSGGLLSITQEYGFSPSPVVGFFLTNRLLWDVLNERAPGGVVFVGTKVEADLFFGCGWGPRFPFVRLVKHSRGDGVSM